MPLIKGAKMNSDLSLLNNLSVKPISKTFGYDRGSPIDRYYIEKFLYQNKSFVKGKVLEVADSYYTKKIGGDNVSESLIIHKENQNADIIADLSDGKNIPENLVDCFIMTQTLLCIFNLDNAVKNSLKLLKPGGSLLVTVPGITQISRYDMDRWGHFWSFTDLSLFELFSQYVPSENIDIVTYGNVKIACAFLYGLAQEDVSAEDFEYTDKDYQLIIGANIRKGVQE